MMRLWLFVACVAVAGRLVADENDVSGLLKKAVEAAGGAEILRKYPAGRIQATGVLSKDEQTFIPVKVEQVYHLPGRSRMTVSLEAMGQKLEIVTIANGSQTRYMINGSPVPITKLAAQELLAASTSLEIASLLPLVTDRKYTIRPDKSSKDPEMTFLVVNTRSAGDIRLGFDRSGHLVRLSRRSYDVPSGQDLDQEQWFSDFQSFEGMLRPTKVTLLQGGKRMMELSVEKFTPLTTVDAREFAVE